MKPAFVAVQTAPRKHGGAQSKSAVAIIGAAKSYVGGHQCGECPYRTPAHPAVCDSHTDAFLAPLDEQVDGLGDVAGDATDEVFVGLGLHDHSKRSGTSTGNREEEGGGEGGRQ